MTARVAVDDIVGLSEIADAYKGPNGPVSRQLARQWAEDADFPAPLRELKQGRLWNGAAVHDWIAEHRPDYAKREEG